MMQKLRSGASLLGTHWVWLLPALLLVLVSPLSLTNFDATRDFIMAQRLVHDIDFPLLGPLLAFSFHIGPWWYYLMALPLLISDSWLGMAVWVAVLNSLKFLLAFRIGTLIKDQLLGQLMVLGLLLVSLTYMQTITFTHTSVVETCMLLMLYVIVKTQLQKYWHWLLFGLVAGWAFHSHPTAVLMGFFALFPWLSGTHKSLKVLSFLLGLLLLLLPMLYQEVTTANQLSSGVDSYFNQQSGGLKLLDLPALWLGLLYTAPVGMLTINLPDFVAIIIILIQLLIQSMAFILPWFIWQQADTQIKRWYLHSWLFFMLSSLGMMLIRERTPWYMTYGLSLSCAMLVAFGLFMVLSHWQKTGIKKLLLLWVLTVFIGVNASFLPPLYQGDIKIPTTTLYDLKSNNHELSAPSFEFPAWLAKNHGELTCDKQPVALHGPYAALIYSHSGMEHLSKCGKGLWYGPNPNTRHLLGIPASFKAWISAPPISQIGGTFFYQPVAIGSQQISWQETFLHDYEKSVPQNPRWQDSSTESQIQGGQNLLVTQLLGFKMQFEILSVKANGQLIEPVASSIYSQLYQCTQCDPLSTRWQVKYQESVQGMTNVVSF